MILPGLPNEYTNNLWTGPTLDQKLSMIKIGEFNGLDGDWLKWSKRVRSSFGEAGLSKFLTSNEVAVANLEANEQIYWKLEGAMTNGAAKVAVSKHQEDKSTSRSHKVNGSDKP